MIWIFARKLKKKFSNVKLSKTRLYLDVYYGLKSKRGETLSRWRKKGVVSVAIKRWYEILIDYVGFEMSS